MKHFLIFLLVLWLPSTRTIAQSLYPGTSSEKTKVDIQSRSQLLSFNLADVKLGEGVFENAMKANREWLLSLSPDRFLNRFHEYAGLPVKGQLYGGWESQGVSGHTLGHYISACAMQYASTGEEVFKTRVDYIVSELAKCQARYTGVMKGYVGGIPEQERIFTEISQGKVYSSGFDLNGGWVPIYTLHKLYAGLIDAYLLCDNEEAKTVVTGCADWLIAVTANLDETKFQQVVDCEIGGMNEVLSALYILTGEQKYHDIAGKFYHKSVLDPMVEEKDQLNGKHANTQIPKVLGCLTEYLAAGNEDRRKLTEFFWQRVVYHHSYSIGGNSDGEHFGEPDHLCERRSSTSAETCNTYNMLKLTKKLFQIDADPAKMDYYERALYNHILASQDPSTGMVCYYVNLLNGLPKAFSTPFDSFWCCVGSGIENHTKYTEAIYFHDKDGDLYVNLFIPSVLNWEKKGIVFEQSTRYPFESKSRFEFTKGTMDRKLHLRYPAWAKSGFEVSINGEPVAHSGTPGSYVTLDRAWKTGDVIEVTMPFSFYTEATPDNPDCRTILYGPLVMAADLEKLSVSFFDIPVIVKDEAIANEDFEATSDPLTFRTKGIAQANQAQLIPFFQANSAPYAVYMDFFTTSQWELEKDKYYEAMNREEELRKRTTDEIQHEMQSERDHNLQGSNTRAGNNNGVKWRDASDGGWFSFDLATQQDTTVQLYAKYWGGDGDSWRKFDILVDGTILATQSLDRAWFPNEEYEAVYNIPTLLLKGKEKVNIRFQAHAGCTAGGSLGCRLVKKSIQDAAIYANTLDEVKPGESKSESAHSLKSSGGTGSGAFINKTYRDAIGEKWFSYILKTDPLHKNQLVCEYYGGETGGVREFEIFINGEKIAKEFIKLNYIPKKFYFVVYDIPQSLTEGKQSVEVKFTGSDGKYIGGIFGIRTLREPGPTAIGQTRSRNYEPADFFSLPFSEPPFKDSEIMLYSHSGTLLYTCRGKEINRNALAKQLGENRLLLYEIKNKNKLLGTGKLFL